MIFVYLRNGQRIDLAEAVSVVQRDNVFFLDSRNEVVCQLPADELFAYSRVSYEALEWEPPFERPPTPERPPEPASRAATPGRRRR